MEYLRVKNWEKFQHYKTGKNAEGPPPWIKLYRSLRTNYGFGCLDDAEKGQLLVLWLLAAEIDNKIPNDANWIRRQLDTAADFDVDKFVSLGFLQHYGNPRTEPQDSPASPRMESHENPRTEVEVDLEVEVEDLDLNPLVASKPRRGSDPRIAQVLDACNEVTGRYLTLTEGRRTKIRARLKDGFTPEQLVDAMRGAHGDPHFRGENETGRRYDRPETVFKNAGVVEDHIEHWHRLQNGVAPARRLSAGDRQELERVKMLTELSATIAREEAGR